MVECCGTQWISIVMRLARILRTLLLITPASHCPGPASRYATCRIAACESLNTATVFTACICKVSLVAIATSSTSPIAHSSASKTSIRPVLRQLLRDLDSVPCLHTAAAPTRPSPEHSPSVHHILTHAAILASFSLAARCVALVAAAVLSEHVRLPPAS